MKHEMRTRYKGLIILLLFTPLFQPAEASLVGQEVSCLNLSAGTSIECSTNTATVGVGKEFDLNSTIFAGPILEVDFSAEAIELRNLSSTTFVFLPSQTINIIFADLDWGNTPGSITGFSVIDLDLGGGQSFLGLGATSIALEPTFSGLRINLAGLTLTSRAGIRINLDVAHISAVPLPGGLALFGLGLAGLFTATRLGKSRKGA